ncbi:MAG: DNA internalization-related competence protein ComEC/Rec2 [Thermodesulfobacteriota bacterium]|nr:DNA internalization-related competence protein ComEC/Rec2 [Thermodesulfobacteriota bacterium]
MFSLSDRTRPFVQWCDHNILIPVTICCILGTVTGRRQPSVLPETAAVIVLLLLVLIAIILCFQQKKAALLLALPLFFLVGYLNTVHHVKAPLAPGHIYNLLNQQRSVTLVGTLATMVEQYSDKSRFEIQVQEILIHGDHASRQPVHGRVRLSMRGKTDSLQPGTTLMILAKVSRITNFKTPGRFDYTGYMAAKNVYVSGWIKDRQHIIQVRDQTQSGLQQLRYVPEQVRQKVALFLVRHLDHDISGLYQALLVGSRAGVSQQVLEQFKATGTMHLLAISGLHMGLLGLMIGSTLNWLLKRSQWLMLHVHVPSLALIGTLPILVGYGFIAGMNTPVLRALIMAVVLLTAVIIRRQHSLLHLIAAAALVMLSVSPLALFTVSFQLSFAAVTALALFFPQLISTARLDAPKPGRTATLAGYAKTALLVSITATLGTLPFMLLYFNRFSLVGPVMNLVVEPFLCFWALPWGLVAIPLIFIAPQAADVFLKIGSLGISAGQQCTALGAAVPFASLWTITPTTLEIFLYGLLILVWRLWPQPAKIVKVAALGGLLLVLHFTWGLWFPEKPVNSHITYLDVGQGSTSFLLLPDGSRILIDGGGTRSSSFNVGERIIAPYLWKQRIWRVDQAIITHPHSDHFNGMDFVLTHFRPRVLYINGDQRSEGNYIQILDQARQQGVDIVVADAGKDIVRGKDFQLVIMGMNGLPIEQNASVNDSCLVLKYTQGRRTFLFPADISRKSENILIRERVKLTADVLLAPHHGSATSNSKQFIAAVNPSLIVVSAGKTGQAHYPAPANLAFWKKQHIQTRITRDQGTITCTTDGSKLDCTEYADN